MGCISIRVNVVKIKINMKLQTRVEIRIFEPELFRIARIKRFKSRSKKAPTICRYASRLLKARGLLRPLAIIERGYCWVMFGGCSVGDWFWGKNCEYLRRVRPAGPGLCCQDRCSRWRPKGRQRWWGPSMRIGFPAMAIRFLERGRKWLLKCTAHAIEDSEGAKNEASGEGVRRAGLVH